MSHPGRRRRFKHEASVTRVPAVFSNESDRETVIACLPCSSVYTLSGDDRERAGLAETAVSLHVYTAVPETVVSDEMYFLLGEVEYRIQHAAGHPEDTPAFMELFLLK